MFPQLWKISLMLHFVTNGYSLPHPTPPTALLIIVYKYCSLKTQEWIWFHSTSAAASLFPEVANYSFLCTIYSKYSLYFFLIMCVFLETFLQGLCVRLWSGTLYTTLLSSFLDSVFFPFLCFSFLFPFFLVEFCFAAII